MPDVRTIRVFIASPGDLAVERAAFQQVLEELNAGFGDALDITFEPLGWEDTLASTGRRSQEVINREIDRCDVFILAMHRRWGQAAPDAQPYSSYTEEEFHRAFHRWQGSGVRFFEIGGQSLIRNPSPHPANSEKPNTRPLALLFAKHVLAVPTNVFLLRMQRLIVGKTNLRTGVSQELLLIGAVLAK